MSATKNRVLAALVLVLTFSAGVIGGAAAHHLLALRRPLPPPAAHMLVRHLSRRLDLTEAQRTHLETVMRRRHERILAEVDAANAEIERVLTPAQREKYQKMRMRVPGPHGRHAPPAKK